MDYGKLAYLRLEELEGTLLKSTSSRTKNTARAVYPDFPLRQGNDYAAAKFLGMGVMTAIVKIGVHVETRGRIAVLLDGQKAGFCDFENLGTDENVSLLSLRLAGTGQVVLQAENGFCGHIVEFSVALMGEDASIDMMPHVFSADKNTEFFAHLWGKDGLLWLSMYQHADASLAVQAEIGYGLAADVCMATDGSGFYVAYADQSQNLWLVKVANSGAALRCRIGGRADRIAVFDAGNGEVLVAYLVDGAVWLKTVDYGFLSITDTQLMDAGNAQNVGFVKQASRAVLLTAMQQKVFARFARPECKALDTLCAQIRTQMWTNASS